MPGSGKSTVSHAFAAELRKRGFEVREPVRNDLRSLSQSARRLRKTGVACRELVAVSRSVPVGIRVLAESSQSTLSAYPAIALNWFYIAGLCRTASGRPGVAVFDQGILQALWSVAFGSDSLHEMSVDRCVALTSEILPIGSVAVLVDADTTVLEERIASRSDGRGRVDAALRRGADAFVEAIDRGLAALEFVHTVANELETSGRLQVIRLDSGSGDPELLACRLSELLIREEETNRPIAGANR
jgi:hypothetical protein